MRSSYFYFFISCLHDTWLMSLTTTKVEVVKVWVQLEVGKTIGELQVDDWKWPQSFPTEVCIIWKMRWNTKRLPRWRIGPHQKKSRVRKTAAERFTKEGKLINFHSSKQATWRKTPINEISGETTEILFIFMLFCVSNSSRIFSLAWGLFNFIF